VARLEASERLSDSHTEFGQMAGDREPDSSRPAVIALVSGF